MVSSKRTASVTSKSSHMSTTLAKFHNAVRMVWHPLLEASCIFTSRQYRFWDPTLSRFLSATLPSSIMWMEDGSSSQGLVSHLSKWHWCIPPVLLFLGSMWLLLLPAHPGLVQNVVPQIVPSLGLNQQRDAGLAFPSCFFNFFYWALLHSG